MPKHPKHHPHHARTQKRLATGLETVDTQWKSYHRYVFRISAEHLSPSDDLVQFALSVTEHEELTGLIAHILARKEDLKLRDDTITDLETYAPDASAAPPASSSVPSAPSLQRLQQVCYRVARHEDPFQPVIADYMLDTATLPAACPPFPPIVAEIAGLFSLSADDTRILMALFALEEIEPLSNVMRQATHRQQMRVLAEIAAIDLHAFVRATAPGAPLARLGLLTYRGGRDEIADIDISRPLLFALRSNTLDDLRAGLFDETPSPQYQLTEFSVPADEVRTCAAAVRGGHPLLIAGEPGVGKTEFARTLVDALGRHAHTIATINRHSEPLRGPRSADPEGTRFSAIRMAVNLLSPSSDVLIIDEADALLQSASGFFALFGGGSGGSYDKAILNDLLEHLPVATIWITNDHDMIPASAMRRFGHVFAFPHPSIDTRVRMISERLAPLTGTATEGSADADSGTSAAWTRDLAARYDITPAAIDRTARIIAAELDAQELSPADVRTRVADYIEQISSGALAHDVRRLPTVSPSFEPRFCSTSESLDRVERQALHRAQTGAGLRLLFGGPPGGGKTQYALWLAKRLGRDVVLKRPSDLLSKWLGDSEKQIAAAFRAAARAGSVLVLDEADALLYDRSIAQRSWEHSQIAEFLQQIQEFTGILIACTNRVDAVDPALRRRFHKHVTFGPISDEVLPPALAHIFPRVPFSDRDIAALRQGPPLMMSDLATAAEMMEMEALDRGAPGSAQGSATAPGTSVGGGTEDHPDLSPDAPPAATIVEEILANARSRDRSRGIGF
jgi:transitional endoplasmic reticulum ATPase